MKKLAIILFLCCYHSVHGAAQPNFNSTSSNATLYCLEQPGEAWWSKHHVINPNAKDVELASLSCLIPKGWKGFNVINTGKESSIEMETYFCTVFGCWTIEKKTLKPFEEAYLSFGYETRSYVHLKASNLGSARGEVVFKYDYDEVSDKIDPYKIYPTGAPPSEGKIHKKPCIQPSCEHSVSDEMTVPTVTLDIEQIKFKLAKLILAAELSMIPFVGSILKNLPDVLFPDKQDYWEPIRKKILKIIDDKLVIERLDIMDREFQILRNQITDPTIEMDANRFLRLVDNVEFKYLTFKSDNISPHFRRLNYAALPMFSSVCLTIITFIVGGITSEKMNLDEVNKTALIKRSEKIVDDAAKHIDEVKNHFLSKAFESGGNVFFEVQTVKEHMGINGYEYLSIMKSTIRSLKEPKNNLDRMEYFNKTKNIFYNPVVSPSPHFGRDHPRLVSFAVREWQPLYPIQLEEKNNHHNKLTVVRCHAMRYNNAPRIGGLEIEFENGHKYPMGTLTDDQKEIKLDDPNLVIDSIETSGCRAIDRITFNLSDGRNITCGEDSWSPVSVTRFEHPSHHIVGLLLTPAQYPGQAGSLSVTYAPNEIIDKDDQIRL